MAYFDLKVMRSYRGAGYNKEAYHFKKGTPTLVNEVDADKFRNQPDIFFEVTQEGTPVTVKRDLEPAARSYKKFRDYSIFGEEETDAEDVLKKAFDQTVAQREAKPVDVAALLAAVNEDEVEKVEEVGDGTITSEDVTPLPVKKKRPRKQS